MDTHGFFEGYVTLGAVGWFFLVLSHHYDLADLWMETFVSLPILFVMGMSLILATLWCVQRLRSLKSPH